MGPGLFLLLVLISVVLIGFALYGVFMGLGTMGGLFKRFWMAINSYDAEPVVSMPGMGNLNLSAAGASVSPNGSAAQTQQPRCWDTFHCSEEKKRGCAAYRRQDLPCWLANIQADRDRKLRPDCLTCKLFNIPAMVARV